VSFGHADGLVYLSAWNDELLEAVIIGKYKRQVTAWETL